MSSSGPPNFNSFSESLGEGDTQRSEVESIAESVLPLEEDERDALLQDMSSRVERMDAALEGVISAVTETGQEARDALRAQGVMQSDIRAIKESQDRVEQKVDALIQAFATFKGSFQTTAPAPPGGD